MNVISVVNRKGGVGKTTLAIALASWMDDRTLLVDLDSQASATEGLGLAMVSDVFDWVAGDRDRPVVKRAYERQGGLGLDVVRGNLKTERLNLLLGSEGDVGALDRCLQRLRHGYKWVILDCAPSMSVLSRAAIYAADWVLCPTVPEYLGLAGVRQLVQQVALMRDQWRRSVRLLGILPNCYDRRTTEHRANLVAMVKRFGAWDPERGSGFVWPPLRRSIAVARSSAAGVPVWDWLEEPVLGEWQEMAARVVEVCGG